MASPEQQRDVASRVVQTVQSRLSMIDKHALLTMRDVRKVSESYWKSLSLIDAMNPTATVEGHFTPHLQMRAVFLWAQNFAMLPYHDLVALLNLPPGYLTFWVRRWAQIP